MWEITVNRFFVFLKNQNQNTSISFTTQLHLVILVGVYLMEVLKHSVTLITASLGQKTMEFKCKSLSWGLIRCD